MGRFLASLSFAMVFAIIFGAIAGPKDSLLHSGDTGALYQELVLGMGNTVIGVLALIHAIRKPSP